MYFTDNVLSDWDSNMDYPDEDKYYMGKSEGEKTELSSGCEGGRALRIDITAEATISVTENTFQPNDNSNPVDPDYVKITGVDNNNVNNLIGSLIEQNTWPYGTEYSTVILVNNTPGTTDRSKVAGEYAVYRVGSDNLEELLDVIAGKGSYNISETDGSISIGSLSSD